MINQKPLAPSPLPCPTISGEVEPLTIDGIQELVQKFGDAAVRAREAGFELLEIHGAHGYLVSQFLSGFSNIREDAYGRDIFVLIIYSGQLRNSWFDKLNQLYNKVC